MSHVQFTDELVREYLLFRGFGGALKAFDADLKVDKDKGFRVDKIVDQLLQNIYNYDLVGLRDTWNHFDTRLFTRLEQHFTPSIRKLENAVLKFYLINASENNKPDKITEFFTKLATELMNQNEWKDWFVFPFIKNPEEHPVFGVYFSKQWQDTLVVSLHNFLAAVYQCMPQPTLSSFEESASKMTALQKENEVIRKGLIDLLNSEEKVTIPDPSLNQGLDGIMDDFFYIAQEVKANESQSNLLKTIMKNIGSIPSSPKAESSEESSRGVHKKRSGKKVNHNKKSLSVDARPNHLRPRERDSSLDAVSASASPKRREDDRLKDYLFLSSVEFNEHKCHVTTVKFNNRGDLVASADVEGNLKVWSTSPSCKTVASFSFKVPILCLDWLPHYERHLISGTDNGIFTLHDIMDTKPVWSVNMESQNSLVKCINDLVPSPVDPSVVVIISSGKLFLVDLRSRKIEKSLNVDEVATCAKMNHNGQLLVIGTAEGAILLMDLWKNDVIEKWTIHEHPVIQLELTADFMNVYSYSRDKFCCKSLNQANSKATHISYPQEMTAFPKIHGRLFCLENTATLMLAVGFHNAVIYKEWERSETWVTHLFSAVSTILDSRQLFVFQSRSGPLLNNNQGRKISESSLVRSFGVVSHRTLLTCGDWSFANQCATCVTASVDGKIKVSTLLINFLSSQ